MKLLPAALSLALLAPAHLAQAASDDAWSVFRAEVETACLAAAEPLMDGPRARVDPFGSRSFGLAFVEGMARGGEEAIAAICVFNKQTKSVEIGGELPLPAEALQQGIPLGWEGLFDPCGGPCRNVFSALAPGDADSLRGLPERVARTVEAVTADPSLAWDARARTILRQVRELDPDAPLDGVATGKRPCTVFWFGFLDYAGEMVGRHQCRVARKDGAISVTKLTGEGRLVELMPLGEGARAAVGRTYLPQQPERSYDASRPNNRGNENFGNFVGVAFAAGSGVAIVSADMHGHRPDATFFEVLLVE